MTDILLSLFVWNYFEFEMNFVEKLFPNSFDFKIKNYYIILLC